MHQERLLEENKDAGLLKYRYIRAIGAGVSGKVELYEDINTGKQYALKLMNLEFMSRKEKESALSEV